jgi:hypothetical protein
VAENIATKRNVFFEKIDHLFPAIVGNRDDDHGGVACSNVDRGSHDRGRGGFVAHAGNFVRLMGWRNREVVTNEDL